MPLIQAANQEYVEGMNSLSEKIKLLDLQRKNDLLAEKPEVFQSTMEPEEIQDSNLCPLASESVQEETDETFDSESQRFALALKRRMLKTQLCQFFRSGTGCRYGDKCAYAHGEEDLRPKPSASEIPEEFKLSNGTRPKINKICFRFLDGFCPFGDECHYIHEKVMQIQEEKKKQERKRQLELQNQRSAEQEKRKYFTNAEVMAPSPVEFISKKHHTKSSSPFLGRKDNNPRALPLPLTYQERMMHSYNTAAATEYSPFEYEARRAAYLRMKMKLEEERQFLAAYKTKTTTPPPSMSVQTPTRYAHLMSASQQQPTRSVAAVPSSAYGYRTSAPAPNNALPTSRAQAIMKSLSEDELRNLYEQYQLQQRIGAQ